MDITAIIGIIAGIGAILGAMYFKHLPLSVFNNPAAVLVILVGTVACILNAFPGKDLKNLGKLFGILFTSDSKSANAKVEIIRTIDEFATVARKEGILALEGRVDTLENEFMKKALRMVIDGSAPEYIMDALTLEMEEIEERHNINASIFSQAGTYAPTLGVLGAVFGLIAAMNDINDTDAVAYAIAAAFIATILGIFTGYVLWNPFANKLKVKNKHEMVEKRMMIEGIISIQKGESPGLIKDKLTSFLSSSEKTMLPAAPEPGAAA